CADIHVALDLVFRLIGHEENYAACRVLTEQRSLGTFGDLNILQVIEESRPRARGGNVSEVGDDAGAATAEHGSRTGTAGGAHAANGEDVVVAIHAARNAEGGDVIREVRGGLDMPTTDLRSGERADGSRHCKDVLRAPSGGNYDLLKSGRRLPASIRSGRRHGSSALSRASSRSSHPKPRGRPDLPLLSRFAAGIGRGRGAGDRANFHDRDGPLID